jgi:signal transduction histidine kinase
MPLDEHAEQLVSIVANQSAAAIHNARLYRGLERANHELEQLAQTLEQRVAERTRELQDTNAELRAAQAQLVHAGKMASIGQLAAGVAHELNTPVASVQSSSDTLARAVVRLRALLAEDGSAARVPDVARMLDAVDRSSRIIDQGSARVEGIVRRLRAFTRLDEAALKRVELADGLKDTLALLAAELGEHIEVITELETLGPVACYPAALNQVFLNLARNAIAAIDGKGRIHVRLWRAGERALVSFADDGRGITQQRLATLFEPRLTSKGGRVVASMGLSICAGIVRDHRGELSVESVPGEGSTFTLSLPLDLAVPASTEP